MAASDTEPFPALSPSKPAPAKNTGMALPERTTSTRRRKSSNLGADPRGDTSTTSLATYSDKAPPPPSIISRASAEKHPRHSKRRKAKTLFRRWWKISLKHTWLNPLIVCVTIFTLYMLNPGPQNPLHAAIMLSYPLPRDPDADPDSPIMYGKGARDFAFVGFYIVFLSFTREFLMQRVMRPLSIRCGMKTRAKQARFMEQMYTAVYFFIFGIYGLIVMSRTPVWYFNPVGMYEGFPHRSHEALFKAYYLLQASYWAQQIIVLLLMLEKPRKDFKELVMHHFITLALIWCSYRFHFTYMGVAVYITHDVSDFFLATSKVLNYVDSPIIGPYFGSFIFIWIYLRHYVNLSILFSIINGSFSSIGPFELNWDTQQYKCWISQYITFALLAALQALNLFWLALILRIAWRFVATWGADVRDERSEEEDEAEPEDLEDTSNSNSGADAAAAVPGAGDADQGLRVEGVAKATIKNGNGNGKPLSNGEQRKKLGLEKIETAPRVLLNGEPVSPASPASPGAAASGLYGRDEQGRSRRRGK